MKVHELSGSGRREPSVRGRLTATMRTPTLAVSILLVAAAVAPANDTPASPTRLPLPEDRDTRVSLPDVALPVAGEGTARLVSLAELRGEKYILHVFASW